MIGFFCQGVVIAHAKNQSEDLKAICSFADHQNSSTYCISTAFTGENVSFTLWFSLQTLLRTFRQFLCKATQYWIVFLMWKTKRSFSFMCLGFLFHNSKTAKLQNRTSGSECPEACLTVGSAEEYFWKSRTRTFAILILLLAKNFLLDVTSICVGLSGILNFHKHGRVTPKTGTQGVPCSLETYVIVWKDVSFRGGGQAAQRKRHKFVGNLVNSINLEATRKQTKQRDFAKISAAFATG